MTLSAASKKLALLPTRTPAFVEIMECLSVSKLPDGPQWIYDFCGDECYVALTLIGDLAKRNFAEKHHISETCQSDPCIGIGLHCIRGPISYLFADQL